MAKVLVANKCDRSDKVIETERGKALASAHGLTFFETSAKSGLNVNEVFQHIAKIIIREKIPNGTNNMGLSGGTKNGLGPKSIRVGLEASDNKDSKD